MNKTRFAFLAGAFIALALLSGCSTVRVPVNVTHPAEIDMKAYKQIAISDIKGNMGDDFADTLKNELIDSEKFKIIDRTRMDAILKELKLSQSDLTNPRNRAKLGKMMAASALITGRATGKYKEHLSSKKSTCHDENGNKYTCTTYYREGIFNTHGGIDIVDVQTGEILRSKALNAVREKTKSCTEGHPEAIDEDALARRANAENVSRIVKAITPWSETVRLPFVKVKKIPKLEQGINHARMGHMDKAIALFKEATKEAELNPDLSPKEISETYWNLGLALEFTDQFDEAKEAFEKGYTFYANKPFISFCSTREPISIGSESKFIVEVKHTKVLKAEKEKLLKQM